MGFRHERLNARRWGAVRRLVLIRDGYRCRQCGAAGRLEVDHIKPLFRGGDAWDHDNLQALCRSCHMEKTRSEQPKQPTPGRLKWREMVDDLMET